MPISLSILHQIETVFDGADEKKKLPVQRTKYKYSSLLGLKEKRREEE